MINEEYPRGRALDVLVAEKVMEFSRRLAKKWPDGSVTGAGYRDDNNSTFYMDSVDSLPNFSTDMSAAWEIVNRLASEWKFYIKIDFTKPRDWTAGCSYTRNNYVKVTLLNFKSKDTIESVADTAPLAICLAALKTVENS